MSIRIHDKPLPSSREVPSTLVVGLEFVGGIEGTSEPKPERTPVVEPSLVGLVLKSFPVKSRHLAHLGFAHAFQRGPSHTSKLLRTLAFALQSFQNALPTNRHRHGFLHSLNPGRPSTFGNQATGTTHHELLPEDISTPYQTNLVLWFSHVPAMTLWPFLSLQFVRQNSHSLKGVSL